MNERIRELWENSDAIHTVYPRQGSPIYASSELLENFAELIVQECMKVTKDYTCNQGCDYSAPVALARHFGVE